MDFLPLSDDEITDSLKAPETKVRKKKEVVLERTVAGWFRLTHKHAVDCSNRATDTCIDPRPQGQYATLTVYVMPNGDEICRYCYVGGHGI